MQPYPEGSPSTRRAGQRPKDTAARAQSQQAPLKSDLENSCDTWLGLFFFLWKLAQDRAARDLGQKQLCMEQAAGGTWWIQALALRWQRFSGTDAERGAVRVTCTQPQRC